MRQFCPYLWKGTLLGMRCPNCDCSDGPDIAAAQAIEARRAETSGSACESAVGEADAPNPCITPTTPEAHDD